MGDTFDRDESSMGKTLSQKMKSMPPLLLTSAFLATVTASFALIAVVAHVKHSRKMEFKATEMCVAENGIGARPIKKDGAYHCYDKDGNIVKTYSVAFIEIALKEKN